MVDCVQRSVSRSVFRTLNYPDRVTVWCEVEWNRSFIASVFNLELCAYGVYGLLYTICLYIYRPADKVVQIMIIIAVKLSLPIKILL
jgi:hypothetical protein